jgi:hypothetical protein
MSLQLNLPFSSNLVLRLAEFKDFIFLDQVEVATLFISTFSGIAMRSEELAILHNQLQSANQEVSLVPNDLKGWFPTYYLHSDTHTPSSLSCKAVIIGKS